MMPDNEPPKKHRLSRFGIFRIGSETRAATMTIDMATSQIQGTNLEDLPDLRPAIFFALRRFKPPTDIDPNQYLADLFDKAVRPFGLTVRPISDGDVRFDALFDSATGKIVGRSEALDGAAPFAPDVLKRINDSIARATTIMADDLAPRIAALTGEPDGDRLAADALETASAEGLFAFEPTEALADALAAVEASALGWERARKFLSARCSIAVRLNRFEAAAVDARTLLDGWSDLSAAEAGEYRNIEAIVHAKAGRVEAAAAIWDELAFRWPGIDPGSRATVLRNLAFSSPQAEPRTLRLFEQAHDAFLQAGNRREAAVSLVYLGDALEHHDGGEAIVMLAKANLLLDERGLIGDALRAALQFARAKRLFAMEQMPEAFDAVLASVEGRRGLIGEEEELLASLALAATLADRTADPRGPAFRQESATLLSAIPSQRFELAAQTDALMDSWDAPKADALRAGAALSRDIVVRIGARTLLIAKDPALGSEQRLAELEALHETSIGDGAEGPMLTPIRLALAGELRDRGSHERAIVWLQRILADAPLADGVARLLLDSLGHEQRWDDALSVATREVALKGESFERLHLLASTALRTGAQDEAFRAAYRAKSMATDRSNRNRAQALMDAALAEGAVFSTAPDAPVVSVTLGELDAELQRYAAQTAADFRMEFWVWSPDKKTHKWVKQPERRAKLQLRTWLAAKFGERINIIAEIIAGAGRLDLLLQLAGGTQVIVEMKMCGKGYSSGYAAAGEQQIRHYMRNRGVHVGYVVVHDGRLRDYGKAILEPEPAASETVRELFVDVRPVWQLGAVTT